MMASLASNKDEGGAKKKSMYNLKLTSAQVDKLGDVLNARGWPHPGGPVCQACL